MLPVYRGVKHQYGSIFKTALFRAKKKHRQTQTKQSFSGLRRTQKKQCWNLDLLFHRKRKQKNIPLQRVFLHGKMTFIIASKNI